MLSVDEARLHFLDGVGHPAFGTNESIATETDRWSKNDSGFDDYCSRATEGGLYYLDLEAIVRSRLGRFTTNVALDIAGGTNGAALQDLLREGMIDRGILTNYLDRRDEPTKDNPYLEHIEGDILASSTWQRIISQSKRHAPDGLSLIMHRPVGALQDLPPRFYKEAAHLLLDMLRPGGILFSQVPLGLIFDFDEKAKPICDSIALRSDIAAFYRPLTTHVLNSVVVIKGSSI